jgi:predicted metal-dependent RNase
MTRAAEFPREPVDTLIVETTRGDHPRRHDYSRESEKRRLGEAIAATIARGGSVLVPVFAFGKTQEVLLMLHELREDGLIPFVPVHIGGLSTRMSGIADRYSDIPGRNHRGFKVLEDFEDLEILPRGQREPEFHPGRIYALSSGMMSEHTVSNRFARRILQSKKHSIIFVGYAAEETPGGRILETGTGGRVQLDSGSGHETPIQCEVLRFDFSGHSPREQIADFVEDCAPRNVILVHGDTAARTWFEDEIRLRLPESRVAIPDPGEEIDLSPESCGFSPRSVSQEP